MKTNIIKYRRSAFTWLRSVGFKKSDLQVTRTAITYTGIWRSSATVDHVGSSDRIDGHGRIRLTISIPKSHQNTIMVGGMIYRRRLPGSRIKIGCLVDVPEDEPGILHALPKILDHYACEVSR